MTQWFKIAWRNLGRNRRRSFFSALALGMGLALLLLMAAVIKGEMRDSMNAAIRLYSGHLQVRRTTYDEDKTSLAWGDLIENPARIAAQIAQLEPVAVSTPRLFASGIVLIGSQSVGVRVVGIVPESEANMPYRDGLISGDFLTADDRAGILIGQSLADKFGLKVGQAVNLLVNTSNGDVDEQTFVIRGIYSTGTPGLDQTTVLMPLSKAQAITQAGDHASAIFVLLKDAAQTDAVALALQGSQYRVVTFEQMNDILVQTEALAGGYMVVIYLIVLAITATVVINTLIMAVFERTREIGVLSAIGVRRSRIMAIFFAESGLLASGGIVIGLILGGLLVLYASTIGFYIGDFGVTGILLSERIYAYLMPADALTLTVLAFVVTLVASLYPAWLAARMEPVQALRGGE
ncbi:MAG: FtsX-like permease family protein [Anaerolineae bacterium]|nr:FtsX-like permease family protein [Thermoflexales bacterium]MDW8407960.1 FtsX-like permease family protein [Anaerolineae bacterium]